MSVYMNELRIFEYFEIIRLVLDSMTCLLITFCRYCLNGVVPLAYFLKNANSSLLPGNRADLVVLTVLVLIPHSSLCS